MDLTGLLEGFGLDGWIGEGCGFGIGFENGLGWVVGLCWVF